MVDNTASGFATQTDKDLLKEHLLGSKQLERTFCVAATTGPIQVLEWSCCCMDDDWMSKSPGGGGVAFAMFQHLLWRDDTIGRTVPKK